MPFTKSMCPWDSQLQNPKLNTVNGWVNTGEAGDLRRHRTHYDVIVMQHEDKSDVSFFFILHGALTIEYT